MLLVSAVGGFGCGLSLALGLVVYGLWKRLEWVQNENDELRHWNTILAVRNGVEPEEDTEPGDLTGG